MPETHRLIPGHSVRLAELPTRADRFHKHRAGAEKQFKSLRKHISAMQRRLYAERRRKLLVVFQAMDAGGKDGTIRRVFQGVNPQGIRVSSFKAPTQEELAHDFLWRVHRAVPPAGMIGVFNRSHYEDVLVVRVNRLVPESVWRPRFERINQFEQLLYDSGTTILKFYLHISKDEQKRRFQQRLDDSKKHWKFDAEDLKKRERWDDYMTAFEEMLQQCTTSIAPWHVIPADQKWYRNLAVARVIAAALDNMNPQFPPPPPGLDQFEIR